MSKTVYVVGGYTEYMIMFEDNGWVITDTIEDADLVQFCGGEDVNPALYGEKSHWSSHVNFERDQYESKMYEMAFENHSAIAGICRGGQFVHVMNGGKLFQDVNNHGLRGTHYALIEVKELLHLARNGVEVSSTHHQMMREGVGLILLTSGEATFKATGTGEEASHSPDVEAVYHKITNSLCYQPHPEFYKKDHECQKLYFNLIEELLFNDNDS